MRDEEETKPDGEVKETPKGVTNPVEFLWAQVSRYRYGKLLILFFAVVSVVYPVGLGIGKIVTWTGSAITYFNAPKWPSEPIVLYIYPNGEFGLLRKNGFEWGVKTVGNKKVFHVQPLASSFKKLKVRDISEIENDLSDRLRYNNVVAVVAPSITEATRPLIMLVRQSNAGIPIIIESSIDPIDINWQADSHLFRLSSGVDTRGIEIGHVIVSLLNNGRPVAIIAEDGSHTYGGKMLQYAGGVSPLIASVPTFPYEPGLLGTKLEGLFQNKTSLDQIPDKAIQTLQDPNAVVFFLGLGDDMEPLLKLSFSENSTLQAQAKLVGIMSAYKLARLYDDKTNKIKSGLIYEITDFDFIAPFNPPPEAVQFKRLFSDSKPLSPVLRDQAYSYDEATLLSDAIAAASRNASSYADGCKRISEYLHTYSGRGVTGSITLGGRPSAVPVVPVGQNVGSTILRLSTYQRDKRDGGEWIITSTSAL